MPRRSKRVREKGRKRDRERRRGREAHKMRHTLGEVETGRNRGQREKRIVNENRAKEKRRCLNKNKKCIVHIYNTPYIRIEHRQRTTYKPALNLLIPLLVITRATARPSGTL